jgi:predicted dehydrogenase
MAKIKSAVIGCGRIGCSFDDNNPDMKITRTHAASYYYNPKTVLVALCDIDSKKLRNYGKKYRIKNLYSDPVDMFKKENLDCVSICTNVESHLPLVREAANNGVKGIFLEKPISNSLINAKRIIQVCEKENIVLEIDHQRRFNPFYHSIKRHLLNNEIGDIQLVNVNYGAGIANTGSHLFDIIRLFFGEVLSVKGQFSTNFSNDKLDPNLDVILKLKKRFFCYIHALNLKNFGIFEMEIFGSNGKISLDLSGDSLGCFKPSKNRFPAYKKLISKKIPLRSSGKSALMLGIEDLVKCVEEKKKPMSTGYDAYKALELIVASIKSAKKNKSIDIPLLDFSFRINSK